MSTQLNELKAQAIQELLEAARLRNQQYNSSVVRINEPDKVINFDSIPVSYIQSYLASLKDSS